MNVKKIALVFISLFSILIIILGATYYLKTKGQNIVIQEPSLKINGYQDSPVPYGLSNEYVAPYPAIGIQNYLLSGILLEKPELQDNGFVKFNIGIDQTKTELFNISVFIDPIQKNDSNKVALTFVNDPELVYKTGGIRSDSRLVNLDEALGIYESKVNTQIAFQVLVGDTPASLEEYYRSGALQDPKCSNNCQQRHQRVIQRLDETYETINFLRKGDTKYDGGKIFTIYSNAYVK